MKFFAFFALIVALFGLAHADGGAVVLTESDFWEKTSNGVWFIKFFAPWCGHCKTLAPTWASYADKANTADFHVASVDCTQHRPLCSSFGIKGFPTLKLIKDGEVFDYQSHRTVEAFETFVSGGYKDAPKAAVPQH